MYTGNIISFKIMLPHLFQYAANCRVGACAGGVRLHNGISHFPFLPQSVDYCRWIGLPGGGKAQISPAAGEDFMAGPGDAFPGEQAGVDGILSHKTDANSEHGLKVNLGTEVISRTTDLGPGIGVLLAMQEADAASAENSTENNTKSAMQRDGEIWQNYTPDNGGDEG